MKILIIEDEPSLNKSMVDYLTAEKYRGEAVGDYWTASEKIEFYQYDCIVLDLTLPGGSGFGVLQLLKNNNKTPGVIIISARNELDDKIKGLQLGADDYLTKPFHLPELNVRIAAILRRKNAQGFNTLFFEDIQLALEAKTVFVAGKEVCLTKKEYDLLVYFVINKNKVLSKNSIVEHLWGDDMDIADNYDFIYTHIKNIRKKLMQAGAGDYIRSVYAMGYKFSKA